VAKEVGGAFGTTAATVEGRKGFVHWYEGHLSSRPVTTKAITGSFLWGIGDFVAQVAPTFFAEDDVDDFTTRAVIKKEFANDFPRTAKAVFFGFVIHAPLSHVHYNFLEWMTVKAVDPLVSGDGQTVSYQPHIHANTIRSSREQHRCSHNL